jgi:hypothetical protein
VVLAIEPPSVPALKGGLQRKVKEISVRPGLDANPANYLAFGSAGLIFQEEIVFEELKVWEDGEVSA